jgi:hypothetical protein
MTRHPEPRYADEVRWWHHVIPTVLSAACVAAGIIILQPFTSCGAERDPPTLPPLTTVAQG